MGGHLSDAEQTLSEIRALLDSHDETDVNNPLPERVASVIKEADAWCWLAMKAEHELHRALGRECERCAEYLSS